MKMEFTLVVVWIDKAIAAVTVTTRAALVVAIIISVNLFVLMFQGIIKLL